MVIIELEPQHLDMMVEITQFQAQQNYLPSASFDTRENLGGIFHKIFWGINF